MERTILVVVIIATIFIKRYLNYSMNYLYKQKKRNEVLLKFYTENKNTQKKYYYKQMIESCKIEIERAKIVNRVIIILLIVTYIIIFILVKRDDIFKIVP